MSELTTPQAILLGLGLAGALAGVGLYFGLRTRTTTTAPSYGAVDVAETRSVATGPPPLGVPPLPASATVNAVARGDSASALDAASRAFESQRAKLGHDCWEPSVAHAPEPRQIKLTFTLDYGADGHEQSRSLRQDPSAIRPDVAMCVQRSFIATIAPIGAPARVVLSVSLP